MNFWQSLTGRLFKLVFGWYLALAIAVTSVQLVLEYVSVSNAIRGDLESLGRSFVPSVADALWSFDHAQLAAMTGGIVQTAVVTGVRIESAQGEVVSQAGVIPNPDGAPGSGLLAPYQRQQFALEIKTPRGETKRVGQLVLYSDRKVALGRIEYSFIVILINSLIKTAGLWLIFYLVITRSLARPLAGLTDVVSRVEFVANSSAPVALDYPHQDELGRLLSAMNKMQERVTAAREEVVEVNRHLEETVASRTQALRESEQKLRALFELSPLGIALTDMSGRYIEFNEAFRRICGYSAEELKNLDYWTLTPREYEASESAQLDSLARTGYYGPFEKEYRRKDGSLVPLRLNGMLVIGADGQRYIWSIVEDITERNRVEEQLRCLNATLDKRVQDEVAKNMDKERLLVHQSRLAAMGEMIGNIAHQWRQPLSTLAMVLANIKDDYEYNALDQGALNDAVHKGEALIRKMSSTIDDFRDFFKPNKEKEAFRLEKSVQETVGLIGSSLKGYGIDIRVHGDSGPETMGFPNEFSQVLLNIFSNAKDAIIERNIQDGWIDVFLGHDAKAVWVKITDNAGGIADDVMPNIFDPYFTTKEKGTGIGLYMSRTIVENHMNGTMEVRNGEAGAEVTVTLPNDPDRK